MTDLLPVSTPIDLSNCEREPIHIPGSVQPHGVLVGLREPDLVVEQVSGNCASLLGLEPDALLGRSFVEVCGPDLGAALVEAVGSDRDPAEHYPVSSVLPGPDGPFAVDAILHRSGGLLVVELEPGVGPLSFDNTYRATRTAVSRMNRAASFDALTAVGVEEVRSLTGFDRVMLYRFDAFWNGEVVAEAKRDDLNSFLGLHYPSTDIPAQARALYRQNWLRLIVDVGYAPAPLTPVDNPLTGQPLDLSHSVLRSVSPIHIEYLRNMGVTASMSISLIDASGELWGLIACHHYSGPHRPPYEVRAAAEFLGQALTLRILSTVDDEATRRAREVGVTLAALTAAAVSEHQPAAVSLTEGVTTVLDLVGAGGAAVSLDGEYATVGTTPPETVVREMARWVASRGEGLMSVDAVPLEAPTLARWKDVACGLLGAHLSEDQFVLWFRPERIRTVDWGGDPHNKAIAEREGDSVRLSPRKSFERWRETVSDRAEPWTGEEVDVANRLRRNLIDASYGRARRLASVAETLQRSLLPARLPGLPGYRLAARYSPTSGDDVGGDWYDVVELPGGRAALVLGDVAGHGISAASTMGQLRAGLRAYLVEDEAPSAALRRLNRAAGRLMPLAMATAVLALVDPATGEVRLSLAGHPPPLHVPASGEPTFVDVAPAPPLGALEDGGEPPEAVVRLAPGDALVLYSDGLVERRDESLDEGFERLRSAAAASTSGTGATPASGDLAGDAADRICADLLAACRDPASEDDATILVVQRDPER